MVLSSMPNNMHAFKWCALAWLLILMHAYVRSKNQIKMPADGVISIPRAPFTIRAVDRPNCKIVKPEINVDYSPIVDDKGSTA